MIRFAVVVLLLLWMSLFPAGQSRVDDLRPTLVLVSFDGWRWDYHTKAPTPNLRALMTSGVRAENLIPIFPSKTFPNHYSIVTGLYAGHHGIVANNIRDETTGRTFSLANRQEVGDAMWWGGEPIWVTAQRAGQPAAAMFWPGSEAPIGGVRPRYWKPFDENLAGAERVDQVLTWLDLPVGERPTFLTLYFEDVDTAGHEEGPESRAVQAAIVKVDGYLGRLLSGLERRGLRDRVNVMVVSDHGMSAVSMDRTIVLDDYVSLDTSEVVDINPMLGIFPKAGTEDAVYRALANAHPRLKMYRRPEIPETWHLRDHRRVPPILGVVDDGWQLVRRQTFEDVRAGRVRPAGGQHGYDPAAMSMRGLLVASGPAFKRGVIVPPFENVHLYNVMAQVLGVTPVPNDGDPAIARSLLR